MRSLWWIVFAPVATAAPAVPPLPSQPGVTRTSPALAIATTVAPASWPVVLHPLADANRKESWLRNLVHGTLVTLDRDWSWQCQLCANMPSTSNGLLRADMGGGSKGSRRGINVDFEIPAHATWADGTPLTAQDFKLAFDIASTLPPTTDSGNAARAIAEFNVDSKNAKRFSVRLKESRGDFWFASRMRPIPAHLEAGIWAASEGNYQDYMQASTYVRDPLNPGLYSGPWFPKSNRPPVSTPISMEANKGFAAGKVTTEAVSIHFFRDDRAAAAALQAGSVDIIPETDLTAAGAKSISLKNNVKFALGSELEHLDFNTRNPLLTDINLRKAISLIINRYTLAGSVGFPGSLPMATGLFHPAMAGRPSRLDRGQYLNPAAFAHPVWTHAPGEAFALLQQSGWTRESPPKSGAGPARWTKEGVALELDLDSNKLDLTRASIVREISRQLSEAGIKVNVRDHSPDAFARETIRKLRFKYLAAYGWKMPSGVVPEAILDSRQIPSLQNGYTGENTAGWSSKGLDEVLEQLRQEWNPALRLDMLREIEDLATADVPFIPLFYRPLYAATSDRLSGFNLPGHDTWSSGAAREWTLNSPK
ncbi:hypothetical protein EBZ80_02705 [bacterium]|nr:hypothetical protein [bacterium]